MQKIFIVLTLLTISTQSNAFSDLQATKRISINRNNERFLDTSVMPIDEYTYSDNELAEEEYDQNVSDNVQPPKICPAKELLARMLGSLLVHYLNMQHWAHQHFQEFKDMLASWYVIVRKAV